MFNNLRSFLDGRSRHGKLSLVGGGSPLARFLPNSALIVLCLFLFLSDCLASQAQITGAHLNSLPGHNELIVPPAPVRKEVPDSTVARQTVSPDPKPEGAASVAPARNQVHPLSNIHLAALGNAVKLAPQQTVPNKVATAEAGSDPANVTGISLEPLEDGGTLLVLGLDRPVAHEIFVLTEPDRIVVDLENALGAAFINAKRLKNDLVGLVHSGMRDDGRLHVVMDLNGPAYTQGIQQGPDGDGRYRLVIGMHPVPVPAAEKEPSGNEWQTDVDIPVPPDTDMMQLKLDYKQAPLGHIDAIQFDAGYMLPLSQLFQLLGFAIEVVPESGLATGWFVRPNWNFILDVSRGNAIVKGKESRLPPALVQIRGQEIYVDSTLLEKYFPVLLRIDPAALSLTLEPNPEMLPADQLDMVDQWLTTNGVKAKPRMPEPGEQVSAPSPRQPVPSRETPVKETVEEPAAEQVEEPIVEVSDEDLIVLQPSIENSPIDDFIEVYQVGEHFLVPLQVLSDILNFSITVYPDTGTADGWYLSENRKFSLDTNKQRVSVEGEQKSYPANAVHVTDTDFFIDSRLLSQWFPVGYEIDLRELSLVILPREALPFQIREKRLKKWARLQQIRGVEKSYPVATKPYSLSGMPFMDLNLKQTSSNRTETDFDTFYSLMAAGDLGYLNTNLFMSGSRVGGALGQMRVTSGRRSDSASLLGPLKATQFFVGDINSLTVPLVAESSLGRGVSVSNWPLYRSSQFDSTNFIGDALPEWEVELYRNGALIDFLVIDADGRYEFLDVPILYGNNTFQLIFNGPQGQIREEVKRFNIGASILRKGELIYELSVDEKSKQLFGIDEDSDQNHPEKVRIVGELEYGLTNSLGATFGLVSTPLRDGEHRYLTAGLRTNAAGILGSLDAAYDESNGGWATKFSAFTSIKSVNIKAEHRLLDNFHSEELNDFNLPLESKTELNLNTTLSLPFLRDLYFNLNASREEFETGQSRTTFKNKLAKSLLGVRFTNTLETNSLGAADSSGTTDSALGQLAFRGWHWSTLLRGALNYRAQPNAELNRFEVSAQRKTYKDAVTIFRLAKNLQGDKNAFRSLSMNWYRKDYIFSLSGNVDDQSGYSISGNLNFSLGRKPSTGDWHIQGKPMANSGGLSARAFLDNNFNQQLDDGEEIIDQARFKVNKVQNNTEDGLAFVTGLPVNRPSSVTIDSAGDDPLWIPAIEGYRFLPRPGVVTTIDFPIVTTSEIDGTVYLVNRDGQEKTLARVEVQLVDAASGETVKTFRSEFDGFYLLEKVRPGKYLIRVREKDRVRLNARASEELMLEVGHESDVYRGFDIRLIKAQEQSN